MSATGEILDQIDRIDEVRKDLELVLSALQAIDATEQRLLNSCAWSVNRASGWLEEIGGKLSEALARVKEGAA